MRKGFPIYESRDIYGANPILRFNMIGRIRMDAVGRMRGNGFLFANKRILFEDETKKRSCSKPPVGNKKLVRPLFHFLISDMKRRWNTRTTSARCHAIDFAPAEYGTSGKMYAQGNVFAIRWSHGVWNFLVPKTLGHDVKHIRG